MSDPKNDEVRAWLDSLDPAQACTRIEETIAAALHDRDLQVVPGLLVLMCRYDPHRAAAVRDTMLLGIEISRHGWSSDTHAEQRR